MVEVIKSLSSQIIRRAHNAEDKGEDHRKATRGIKRSRDEIVHIEFGAAGETMRLVGILGCEVQKYRKLMASKRTRTH